MFAVIHDGITVKDKDGNIYKTFHHSKAESGLMYVRFEQDGDGKFERFPILEHGKKYLVKKDGEEFVARFDADTFEFQGPSWWLVSECQGFAPIPQMINI